MTKVSEPYHIDFPLLCPSCSCLVWIRMLIGTIVGQWGFVRFSHLFFLFEFTFQQLGGGYCWLQKWWWWWRWVHLIIPISHCYALAARVWCRSGCWSAPSWGSGALFDSHICSFSLSSLFSDLAVGTVGCRSDDEGEWALSYRFSIVMP